MTTSSQFLAGAQRLIAFLAAGSIIVLLPILFTA
jgi:hypothetical protein